MAYRIVLPLVGVSVAGCTAMDALGFLSGSGGPSVNTNAQVGQSNTQAVSSTVIKGAEQVVIDNAPIAIILVLVVVAIIGWMAPRPATIWKALKGVWSRK